MTIHKHWETAEDAYKRKRREGVTSLFALALLFVVTVIGCSALFGLAMRVCKWAMGYGF